MPEFLVSPKFKDIFNEYDLSVIKADHYLSTDDLKTYKKQFISCLKQRYANLRWLPPPLVGTIRKIESLTDDEFNQLMKTFRYI
jgi:hypothetical protein